MRVMIIVKEDQQSEAGTMPDEQILTAMGNYNEQLMKAGVMQAAEGLTPSSKGKRVRFADSGPVVIDGPFAETKELIAGFWLWQVDSMDHAVEWLKKSPFGGNTEIEIRPIAEMDDFGDEFTPEARAQEARIRTELEAKAKVG